MWRAGRESGARPKRRAPASVDHSGGSATDRRVPLWHDHHGQGERGVIAERDAWRELGVGRHEVADGTRLLLGASDRLLVVLRVALTLAGTEREDGLIDRRVEKLAAEGHRRAPPRTATDDLRGTPATILATVVAVCANGYLVATAGDSLSLLGSSGRRCRNRRGEYGEQRRAQDATQPKGLTHVHRL